ncbi:MAG: MFS transporter [Candidatus Andeanibacterium colombiense]|uniref:MFS transporter n=1 Tax=Candidatus Andeanibacterium colombiense TaxID=3121345 RepID=A0AAJ5X3Y5_9SPHN|nr:MAG: MFS transporter [Sphingomonadaceae bacterium]
MASEAPDPAMDPRQILGTRRMTLPQYAVIGLCVLINMIDGYDILALAQAGSALKREWGLSDAALGTLLSMNLVGMALGALGVSPVADQWGRRPAILASLVFMSAGMALAAASTGFYAMAAGRIVTGIGIGGMTSTAGMLALEYAHFKRREFASSCVASAYPVGTIVGAYVAVLVLDSWGWRGIFWVGSGLSLLLFPIAFGYLAESLDFLLSRQPKDAVARTNRMLRRMAIPEISELPPKPEGARDAVLAEIAQPLHIKELLRLFLAHAFNMFAWYFIINWGPPLVSQMAADDKAGALYSSWVSYGGIAGGLAGGWLCGAWGVKRMMWATMIALAVLIALFGQFAGNQQALWVIAPLMGAMLFGSATANWLTIAYAFPPQLRATGLGFGTTAGRIGAVFGPIVGGRLLGDGLNPGAVCAIMAVPAILSAVTFSFARRIEPGR